MKFGWRGAIGILVSVACLGYVFATMDWAETREQLAHADYALLALSAACATGMFPIRARKWRTILDPVAPRLPFGPLWRSTAIGMMVNNTVPVRAGEPARAYALTREVPGLSFSTSLASLAVDRAFDAMVVIMLTALALVLPGSPTGGSDIIARGAYVFIGGAVILMGGLYSLVFFPETLIRLFELLARRVSPAIEKRGAEALRLFAQGLGILRSPAHFAAVFGWTVIHWLLQPVAFWLAFKAVGVDVPWSATLLVQGAIVVGVSVPSSPGYFGPFELAAKLALPLYGISANAAATWAITFHIASFLPITIIGAYYFARLGIRMSDVSSAGAARA
jgi:glycosyltransferase 2 family protein